MSKMPRGISKAIENLRNIMWAKASIQSYWLKKHIKEFSLKIDNNFSLILDVGSGKQPYQSIFRFQKYVTIDIKKGEADLIADICSLPLKASVADIVICTEVLEHVQDTERAIRNLNRVIKKGGYLILSTPLLFGEHGHLDYFRFTEMALRYYLKKHGFVILEFKRRGGIFSALGSILSNVPTEILATTTQTQLNLLNNQKEKNSLRDISFLILYVIFIPLKKIFILLDRLDKIKKFTSGYELCCIKKENYECDGLADY